MRVPPQKKNYHSLDIFSDIGSKILPVQVLALVVTIGSVVASKSDSAQTTFIVARQLRAVIQHEALSPGQPPCDTVPCPISVPQGHGKAVPQGHGNALRAEVRIVVSLTREGV